MTSSRTPVLLTFDTDWAPSYVLRDVLDLLGDAPATFFVTDPTAAAMTADRPALERGIHPNFMPGSSHGASRSEVVDSVLELAPEARSVRSHNLCQDSTVLDLYRRRGLACDLSLLEYGNPSPRPFTYWNGLVRVPYNYEDDVSCLRGDLELPLSLLDGSDVLICDFHPIHVFLNSETMDRYAALRRRGPLQEITEEVARSFVRHDGPGIRTIFREILDRARGAGRLMTVSDWLPTVPVLDWSANAETLRAAA